MALRALVKSAESKKVVDKSSVALLYRSIVRELPRVLILYDVDMPLKTARASIRHQFRKNHWLRDGRVISLLLAKGYMELEETLMQWKQKTHLLRILEPSILEEQENKFENLTAREKFFLNVKDDDFL